MSRSLTRIKSETLDKAPVLPPIAGRRNTPIGQSQEKKSWFGAVNFDQIMMEEEKPQIQLKKETPNKLTGAPPLAPKSNLRDLTLLKTPALK